MSFAFSVNVLTQFQSQVIVFFCLKICIQKMSFFKALFALLFLVYLIRLLGIVNQMTVELVQARLDADPGNGGGLGWASERGTRMGVGSFDGCSNAKGSGLILSVPEQTVPKLDQSLTQETSDDQMPAADAAASKLPECVRAAEATVERLQQDAKAANAIVVQVTESLESTQATAVSAKVSAMVAAVQLNWIKNLADQISSKLANKKKEANIAQAQLDEHKQLLEEARMRVANATRRVADAQADFDKTKEAVMRAALRAQMQQSYGGNGAKINRTGFFL